MQDDSMYPVTGLYCSSCFSSSLQFQFGLLSSYLASTWSAGICRPRFGPNNGVVHDLSNGYYYNYSATTSLDQHSCRDLCQTDVHILRVPELCLDESDAF